MLLTHCSITSDEDKEGNRIIKISYPDRNDMDMYIKCDAKKSQQSEELFMIILRSINYETSRTSVDDSLRILPESYSVNDKFINYERGWVIDLSEVCLNENLQLYISFLPVASDPLCFNSPPEICLAILNIVNHLIFQLEYRTTILKCVPLLNKIRNCIKVTEKCYTDYYDYNKRTDTDCIYKLTPTDFRINMLISVYQTMCVISFSNESIKLVKPILELIASHLNFAVDIKNRDLIIAIIQLVKNISESRPSWIETLVENNIISAIVHIKDFTLKKINTIQNLPNNAFGSSTTTSVPFVSPLSKMMITDNDIIPECEDVSTSSLVSNKLRLDKTFSPSSQVRHLDNSLCRTVRESSTCSNKNNNKNDNSNNTASSSIHNESRRLKFKNNQMERMDSSIHTTKDEKSSKRSSRKLMNRTVTPLQLDESLMSKLEEIARQQDEESKSMSKSIKLDESNNSIKSQNNDNNNNNNSFKRSRHQRNRSNLYSSITPDGLSPTDRKEEVLINRNNEDDDEEAITPKFNNKSKISKGNVLSLKSGINREDSSNSNSSPNRLSSRLPIPPIMKVNNNDERLETPPPPRTTENNTYTESYNNNNNNHPQQLQQQQLHQDEEHTNNYTNSCYYRGQRRASATEIENKLVDKFRRKASRRKSTTSLDSSTSGIENGNNDDSNSNRKKSKVSSTEENNKSGISESDSKDQNENDNHHKHHHHHHHHHHHKSRKTSTISEESKSKEKRKETIESDNNNNNEQQTDHHHHHHHHHHHNHKGNSKSKSRSTSKDGSENRRRNSSIADDEKDPENEEEDKRIKAIDKMDVIKESVTPNQTPPLSSYSIQSNSFINRNSIELDKTMKEMLKDPLRESEIELKEEHPSLQINDNLNNNNNDDDSSSEDENVDKKKEESKKNEDEEKKDNSLSNGDNNYNNNNNNERKESVNSSDISNEMKPPLIKSSSLSVEESNPSSRASPSLPPKIVNNHNKNSLDPVSDQSDNSFKITKDEEREAIENYKMFSNSIESRSKLVSAKARCASIHLSGTNVKRFPLSENRNSFNDDSDDRPMIPKFATEFSRSNSAVAASYSRNTSNSDLASNNNNNNNSNINNNSFDRRFSPRIGAYRKSPLGRTMMRPESMRLTPLVPPLDINNNNNNNNSTNLNVFNVTTGVIGSSMNRTGRTFHRIDDSSPILGNNNNNNNNSHSDSNTDSPSTTLNTIHNVSANASININTPKIHNVTLKDISPSSNNPKNEFLARKISELNYSNDMSVDENPLSFGRKVSQYKLSRTNTPKQNSDSNNNNRRASNSSYYDSADEEIVYYPRGTKFTNTNPIARTRLSTQYIRITPTYSIRSKTPFILIDRVVIRTLKLMVSNAPSSRVKTNIQLQISIGDSLPYLMDQINSTDKELHNITKECLCELYGKDTIIDSLQIENILLILNCDVLMIIWRASHALLSYIQLHYTEQELISTCIEKIDLFMEIIYKLIDCSNNEKDENNKETKTIGDINIKQKTETIDNFIEVLTILIKDPSSEGEIWNSHTDSGEEGLEILFQLITVNELCSQQSLSNIANILLYFIQSDGNENMIAYSARRIHLAQLLNMKGYSILVSCIPKLPIYSYVLSFLTQEDTLQDLIVQADCYNELLDHMTNLIAPDDKKNQKSGAGANAGGVGGIGGGISDNAMFNYITLLYELVMYEDYNTALLANDPIIVNKLFECFSETDEELTLLLINLFIRIVDCAEAKILLLNKYPKFLPLICKYAQITDNEVISKRALKLIGRLIYLLYENDINLLNEMNFNEINMMYQIRDLSIFTVVLKEFNDRIETGLLPAYDLLAFPLFKGYGYLVTKGRLMNKNIPICLVIDGPFLYFYKSSASSPAGKIDLTRTCPLFSDVPEMTIVYDENGRPVKKEDKDNLMYKEILFTFTSQNICDSWAEFLYHKDESLLDLNEPYTFIATDETDKIVLPNTVITPTANKDGDMNSSNIISSVTSGNNNNNINNSCYYGFNSLECFAIEMFTDTMLDRITTFPISDQGCSKFIIHPFLEDEVTAVLEGIAEEDEYTVENVISNDNNNNNNENSKGENDESFSSSSPSNSAVPAPPSPLRISVSTRASPSNQQQQTPERNSSPSRKEISDERRSGKSESSGKRKDTIRDPRIETLMESRKTTTGRKESISSSDLMINTQSAVNLKPSTLQTENNSPVEDIETIKLYINCRMLGIVSLSNMLEHPISGIPIPLTVDLFISILQCLQDVEASAEQDISEIILHTFQFFRLYIINNGDFSPEIPESLITALKLVDTFKQVNQRSFEFIYTEISRLLLTIYNTPKYHSCLEYERIFHLYNLMTSVKNIPLKNEINKNLIAIYGNANITDILKKTKIENLRNIMLLSYKIGSFDILNRVLKYILTITSDKEKITNLLKKKYRLYEELLKLVESIALISPKDKSTKGAILLNKKDKLVKLVLQIFTDISLNYPKRMMFGRRNYFKPLITLLFYCPLDSSFCCQTLQIISNMLSMSNIVLFKNVYKENFIITHSCLVSTCINSDQQFVSTIYLFLSKFMKHFNVEVIISILNILFELAYYVPIKYQILNNNAIILKLMNKCLDAKNQLEITTKSILPFLFDFLRQLYHESSFVHNSVSHLYIKSIIPLITKLFVSEKPNSSLYISYLLLYKYLLFKPSFLNILLRSTSSFFSTLQNCLIINESSIRKHSEELLFMIFQLSTEDSKYHLEDSLPLSFLIFLLNNNFRKKILCYSLYVLSKRLEWGLTPLLSKRKSEKTLLVCENVVVKSKKKYKAVMVSDAILFYSIDSSKSEDILPKLKLFLYQISCERIEGKCGLLLKWQLFLEKPTDVEIVFDNENEVDIWYNKINEQIKKINVPRLYWNSPFVSFPEIEAPTRKSRLLSKKSVIPETYNKGNLMLLNLMEISDDYLKIIGSVMLKYEKDKLLNHHIYKLYSIISNYMNTNDPYIHGVVFIEPSQAISNENDDEIIMPDSEPTYLVQTSIIEETTIEPSVGDWLFNNRNVLDIKSIPVDFSQHLLLKEISEETYVSKSPDIASSNVESPDSRSRCDTIDNLGVVDYELENNPSGYRTRSSSSSLLLKKVTSSRGLNEGGGGGGGEEGSENEDELMEMSHSVSDLTMMKTKLSDYHPPLNKNFEVIKEEPTPRPTEEDEENKEENKEDNKEEEEEEKVEEEKKEEEEVKEEIKEEKEDINEENEIEINDIQFENVNSTTTDTFDNNSDNPKELPPIPTSVGDLTARTASTNDIPSLPLRENCEIKDEKEDDEVDENNNSTSVNADSSTEESNIFSNDTSSDLLTPSSIQQSPPPPPPLQQNQNQNQNQNIDDDDNTSSSTPQIEPIPLSSLSSNDNPVDLRRSISIHHLKEVTPSDYQPALNLSIDVNDLPFSPCGQIPQYSYSYEGLSSPFTPTLPNVKVMKEHSPYTPFSPENEGNDKKKDKKSDK